jgi:hypothetical protein
MSHVKETNLDSILMQKKIFRKYLLKLVVHFISQFLNFLHY